MWNSIRRQHRQLALSLSVIGAFTLVQLLLVITVLTAIVLPVLATTKLKMQGIHCMNNEKQLLVSWLDDHKFNSEHPFFSGGTDTRIDSNAVTISIHSTTSPCLIAPERSANSTIII
jgi:hypothetical protein